MRRVPAAAGRIPAAAEMSARSRPAAIAYRAENVVLIDGVLYAGDPARHLTPRPQSTGSRVGSNCRASMKET